MLTKEIKVQEGILEGDVLDSIMVFKGVPYAKPPVGELRWKAPQPADHWDGVRSAHEFSAIAPQPDMSQHPFYGKEFYTSSEFPSPAQSEDCLYLNVWAPSEPTEGGYPVAVWVHGGGFEHGYGSEMEFDGEAYAKKGVILVTINYRVGVLGFLGLDELADENGSIGNYGLLDQLAALHWVKDNIAAFGGDPNRVTLFGQSAGAISTQAILSSPLCGDDLVHRAIMQSAAGYHNYVAIAHTREKANEIGREVMSLCGVSSIEELKALPSEKFVEIIPELSERVQFAFRPVIDGYFLTESLDDAIKNGHFKEIPVILGSTSEDITVQPGRDAQEGYLYEGCMNFAFARKAPTYIYFFNHHLPGDDAGAFHSSELWYTFGTWQRSWRPFTFEDSMLSKKIVNLWTHFIAKGYPSDWEWPTCNDEQKIPYVRYLQ